MTEELLSVKNVRQSVLKFVMPKLLKIIDEIIVPDVIDILKDLPKESFNGSKKNLSTGTSTCSDSKIVSNPLIDNVISANNDAVQFN